MELQTSRFGTLVLDEHRRVDFPDGIPGFPDFVQAVLIVVDENPDFYWLQSTSDGDLAFLTVVPWSFFPDYEAVLSDEDQEAIGLEDAGDALICCLVSVDRARNAYNANLRAPIVVNVATNRARQVVLPDERLDIQAEIA
jgi:flagellar assembly factor FliW